MVLTFNIHFILLLLLSACYILDCCNLKFKTVVIKLGDRTLFRITFNFLYLICFMSMFFCVAFRYGEGEDYYHYQNIFSYVKAYDFKNFMMYMKNERYEIGWCFINHLFYVMGLQFKHLCIVLAIIDAILIERFIKFLGVESKGVVVLFYLMPTYYFTFLQSGMRQGLIMCIFSGIMVPFLLKKKYISYYIWNFIAVSFHTLALIYAVFPLIVFLSKRIKNKISTARLEMLCILSAALGAFLFYTGIWYDVYAALPTKISGHFYVEFSLGAVLLRLSVFFLMRIFRKKTDVEYLTDLYRLYLWGNIFFFVFSGLTLMANRLYISFGITIEIILLVLYLKSNSNSNNKRILLLALMGILMAVYIKNVDARMTNLGFKYYKWYNYPVETIFKHEEKIQNWNDILNQLQP